MFVDKEEEEDAIRSMAGEFDQRSALAGRVHCNIEESVYFSFHQIINGRPGCSLLQCFRLKVLRHSKPITTIRNLIKNNSNVVVVSMVSISCDIRSDLQFSWLAKKLKLCNFIKTVLGS